MNRLILTTTAMLLAMLLCTACRGGRPVQQLPPDDGLNRPVSKQNLRIGVTFSGIPLRNLANTAGVDPAKVQLTMLELKQGGRLIFPHDDPNWFWFGTVLQLADREWLVSELQPGNQMVLQIRFAPGFDVDKGQALPADSPYRALLKVPITVPQHAVSRCDIDISMRMDAQGSYKAETLVSYR